jgi:hypothetical protein
VAVHRRERPSAATDVLEQLVQSKNVGRHAFFFVSGEGTEMPNGAEEESGYVLDEEGRIFSFWLGWDAQRGQPVLETWEQVQAEPHWHEEPEYRRAREVVGLT